MAKRRSSAEDGLLRGPEEFRILILFGQTIPHVAIVHPLRSSIVFGVPGIEMDMIPAGLYTPTGIWVPPHATTVNIIQIALGQGEKQLAILLELAHPLGHVDPPLEQQRAVRKIVCLRGVPVLGQFPPKGVKPATMFFQFRHFREHFQGNRRAAVHSVRAIVHTAFQHVIVITQHHALPEDLVKLGLFDFIEHPHPGQLLVDSHSTRRAPRTMAGQQVEFATLTLPDCVVVPVENAHEITP